MSVLDRLKALCKSMRRSGSERDASADAAAAVGGIVAGSAGASAPPPA